MSFFNCCGRQPVLRTRNKSFGSSYGSGSGRKLVFNLVPVLDPDLDQRQAKFFFVLKFLHILIFKAALHQLCDVPTNKVRKKLAIYEDLIVHSVPPPCRWKKKFCPLVGIGIPPPPLPQWVCIPPEPQEGRTHSPAGEGVGVSQFGWLEKKPSTLSTFCRPISSCALNTQLSVTHMYNRMTKKLKPPSP